MRSELNLGRIREPRAEAGAQKRGSTRGCLLCHLVVVSNFFVGDFASLPGHIQIVAFAGACADVRWRAILTPGVERLIVEAVQAHIHHLTAVVEDVLGPIAVMDVPIDDQHALAGISCLPGSHCNVIDEAEALD
eukprot:CAMPEP_0185587976 /NCGR_PEP_ID=MMETSP0434-20130131/51407_1 /TAXON_ID=626734 ORGANISM="Favella taraikaensis, Strain Fe Narragansett Bay" /NCGR_SAMPLE_ID=MMETSP0434 /ASSEMBLY_ACC=CAM_ASM_000379 /LENGTH=133 /DNA_ID=CAMNT_0028210309 /DNA_START=265 /DNA_END=667 /DNA_ORIENTATION=+